MHLSLTKPYLYCKGHIKPASLCKSGGRTYGFTLLELLMAIVLTAVAVNDTAYYPERLSKYPRECDASPRLVCLVAPR